jgi:hypothetical protein
MFRGGRFRDTRNRKLLDGIVTKLAGIDAGELTKLGVFWPHRRQVETVPRSNNLQGGLNFIERKNDL